MSIIIIPDENAPINLAPETLLEEIIQNINTILLTPKGSVPLDRNFGTSWQFIDRPTQIAESMIIADVFDAIEEYEPRVEIIDITFVTSDMTGVITPRLEVSINEGQGQGFSRN